MCNIWTWRSRNFSQAAVFFLFEPPQIASNKTRTTRFSGSSRAAQIRAMETQLKQTWVAAKLEKSKFRSVGGSQEVQISAQGLIGILNLRLAKLQKTTSIVFLRSTASMCLFPIPASIISEQKRVHIEARRVHWKPKMASNRIRRSNFVWEPLGGENMNTGAQLKQEWLPAKLDWASLQPAQPGSVEARQTSHDI